MLANIECIHRFSFALCVVVFLRGKECSRCYVIILRSGCITLYKCMRAVQCAHNYILVGSLNSVSLTGSYTRYEDTTEVDVNV